MKGILLVLFLALVAITSASMVLTPFGYRPANCVRQVPSGTYLKETATGVEAHLDNGTVQFYPRQQNCVEFQAHFNRKKLAAYKARTNPRGPLADGWLDNAGYYPPSEVQTFSGTYTIPPNPPTQSNQVLFYFIGSENFQSNVGVSILQPVLTWGNGHTGWNMASWNCCPQGETWTSSFLTGLKAGGTVSGVIDASGANWAVTSSYNGQNVVLTVPSAQRDFNWVDVTLETYTVTSCGEFPAGPETFSNMKLILTGGTVNVPTWTPWKEPTECGGSLTVVSPSQIVIDHSTSLTLNRTSPF